MHTLIFTGTIYTYLYWIAFYIWLGLEVIGALFQRGKNRKDNASRQDRGSMYVLIGALYAGLFLGFAITYFVPAATITWNQPLLVSIAVVLILIGVAFRWYAIRFLGRYFTRDVTVSSDQRIIQNGPYRYIRHPAYTGTLITMIGMGLGMTNWLSLLAVLLGFFIGHLYRVTIEEKALSTAVGEPYVRYMHRTKRFIPFIY